MSTPQELKEQLVIAHRILEHERLGDYIGHVTARLPHANRILIKPRWVRLGTLRPEDFLTIDLEGTILEGQGTLPVEWQMHTEIYRARPEVQAVAHAHPIFATAFSVVAEEILPLYHRSTYFTEGVPLYPKPYLINSFELGREVVATLGDKVAVLLQGHGATSVGSSIEEAVIYIVFLEQAYYTQWIVRTLGKPPKFLPPDFIEKYLALKPQRFPYIWDYFASLVE